MTILNVISIFVIGFSVGTICSEIFLLKPLRKRFVELRKINVSSMEKEMKKLENLMQSLGFKKVETPKFDTDEKGRIVSPVQINKDKK